MAFEAFKEQIQEWRDRFSGGRQEEVSQAALDKEEMIRQAVLDYNNTPEGRAELLEWERAYAIPTEKAAEFKWQAENEGNQSSFKPEQTRFHADADADRQEITPTDALKAAMPLEYKAAAYTYEQVVERGVAQDDEGYGFGM